MVLTLLGGVASAVYSDPSGDEGGFGALDFVGNSDKRALANAAESASAPDSFASLIGSVCSSVGEESAGFDIVEDTGLGGALDFISTEAASAGSGALDALLATASGTGEVRQGALAVITKHYAGGNYYAAGQWQLASPGAGMVGNFSPQSAWAGGMYSAPQWGRITSGFGYRPRFGRMHKGIDIAMSIGDTVRVPLPGVVDRISYEAGGYGHYVVVKHDDGLETRYAHLSATLVNPGERVDANMPIALSGNTGNSTGPHLHFETRYGGSAIDPQTVFDFAGGMMMATNRNYGPTYAGLDGRSVGSGLYGGRGATGKSPKIRHSSLAGKSTYVVRAGDTLASIASRCGQSVQRLCRLNGLSDASDLQVGSMLKLR